MEDDGIPIGTRILTLNSGSSIRRTRSSSFTEFQNAQRRESVLAACDNPMLLSQSPPMFTPRRPSPPPRARSAHFDASSTMDRLRSSLIGGGTTLDLSLRSQDEDDDRDAPLAGQDSYNNGDHQSTAEIPTPLRPKIEPPPGMLKQVLLQTPAIILIGMFHLMIGIPFGVSYFPIGWKGSSSAASVDADSEGVNGIFPIQGKEALGIRMFLFSTMIGQVVFTYASGFHSPVGLQMVENVPFCHALSHIVISHQGYGTDALATLFVMFGLSSIFVGAVFFLLGHYGLGRVVYYFPTHVLVGLIGGIGLFLAKTSAEVTINDSFGWDSMIDSKALLAPVLFFEAVLRVLERVTVDADGKPIFSLLSPIYFCMITPIVYAALLFSGFDFSIAYEAGYFFPSLNDDICSENSCSTSVWNSIFNKDLFVMWKLIDFKAVSWLAIIDAIPTLLALTLFSLIHVPINIPAFAISTNTEADMDKELVAHGLSNFLSGIFGGLQNYMAYTQSVLYDKSGGRGKVSGSTVAVLTAFLFFVGPTIASYIPRCMAGTLILHVGIDLFLEGVRDSYGKFDALEYAGIWLIVVVMSIYGMDAAMVAGGIAAVSTYAAQSIHYVNPIRGAMSAATLRSSRWFLSNEARSVLLDDRTGRNRILVIQLQGHLFFGNMAQLTDSINKMLAEKSGPDLVPWIVMMDFSLVLGIDSSAAHTMAKLENMLHKKFNVDLCIFVSGSENGFPCQFDLSKELNTMHRPFTQPSTIGGDVEANPDEHTQLLPNIPPNPTMQKQSYSGSRVETSLDSALIFAEDALLAREGVTGQMERPTSSSFDEKDIALQFLFNLCSEETEKENVEELLSFFEREVYKKKALVWKQGEPGDSVKLLIRGNLISVLENEAGTFETIASGNTLGEFGLVQNMNRMSSVYCLSDDAVVYSMSKKSFQQLCESSPKTARLIDMICIRYLSSRVQHVSNRIFETRCLPI